MQARHTLRHALRHASRRASCHTRANPYVCLYDEAAQPLARLRRVPDAPDAVRPREGVRSRNGSADHLHTSVRVLLSFQSPTFQKYTNLKYFSAAHVVISFVSSEIIRCRLLKWLLDHPMILRKGHKHYEGGSKIRKRFWRGSEFLRSVPSLSCSTAEHWRTNKCGCSVSCCRILPAEWISSLSWVW